MQINMKVSWKFIPSFWVSKFPKRLILTLLMGMIKHSQITQSNKFAISLQYLKKEVPNGGHFRQADKRQSFYKLVLSFFMEMARHVQNTQNRKLAIFLQYIKKKSLQLLCLLLWCKTFRYFMRVQSFLFTFYILVLNVCDGKSDVNLN